MARNISQEERQLVKLVESLPLPEEKKAAWADEIKNGNMNSELAEEIRHALSTPAEGEAGNESAHANRTRYLAELANLVRRWTLSSQSHNFGRR